MSCHLVKYTTMEQQCIFVFGTVLWIWLMIVGANADDQAKGVSCLSRLRGCLPEMVGSLNEVVQDDGTLAVTCPWYRKTGKLQSEVCLEGVRKDCDIPSWRYLFINHTIAAKSFVCNHSQEFLAGAECWKVPGLKERIDRCSTCRMDLCIPGIVSQHRDQCSEEDERLLVDLALYVLQETGMGCR